MYEVIVEALLSILKGLVSGTVAFFAVLLLAIVYRYFTNEKFPTFLGIAFGLGFWGFTGGLVDIFEQPTFGGAFEILAVTIFVVWGVNSGDKIAEKIPKKSAFFFDGIRRGRNYTNVKLPNAQLIHDIVGKPSVSDSLKFELSDREFTLPADLPVQDLVDRVKRRLITEWGVGDVELELDQEGKVINLAVSAKEQGLSAAIPEGMVAIPIESSAIPSNLAVGDFIKIFFDNNEVIDRIEVRGVERNQRIVTIITDSSFIEKINGRKASMVVALPSKMQIHQLMSVEHRSGFIEPFEAQKIVAALKEIGVKDTVAAEIARKVRDRLSKLDPPVTTRLVKAAIVKQLEKENPEAAEKLTSKRFWRF